MARRRCGARPVTPPLCVAAFVVAAALLFSCASAADPPTRVPLGKGVRAAAFRPGTRDLYVANYEQDRVHIISYPDPAGSGKRAKVTKTRDSYAEHFMIMPSGIAFNGDGSKFASSQEAINTYRKEPDEYYNSYLGPTLWETDKFAKENQDKRYKSDKWGPFEGSHIDMLHESPYAMGLAFDTKNRYYVLDGCGHKDGLPYKKAASTKAGPHPCKGDGHLVLYDFNDDHNYGGNFHQNGVVVRFLDAPFKRVEGVISGIVKYGDHVIYADTGNGVVRRVPVDGPNAGTRHILVRSWDPEIASGSKPLPEFQDGRGPKTLADAPGFFAAAAGINPSLTTTDDIDMNANALNDWVDKRKNQTELDAVAAAGTAGGFDGSLIAPHDWLHAYGVQLGARQSFLASGLYRPSGIALDATRNPPRLYVAVQPPSSTGVIKVYDYDASGAGALTPKEELQTLSYDLQGVALSPMFPDEVFYVDALKGAVSAP